MAVSKLTCQSMFANGFKERYDLEQYFWTRETVARLMHALQFYTDCCCLATPSLAQAMHEKGQDEVLLDVDSRFEYLPKFIYWDIRNPQEVHTEHGKPFKIVVFDPPFFYIPMHQLYNAVLKVCANDTTTKIMIGFLKREEPLLMRTFKSFGLKRTAFKMEYATVKPNKWANYALYSNIDLPGIKRQKYSRR